MRKIQVLELTKSEYVALGDPKKGTPLSSKLKMGSLKTGEGYVVPPGHGQATGSGFDRIVDIETKVVSVYSAEVLDGFLEPFHESFTTFRDSVEKTLTTLPTNISKALLAKGDLVERTAQKVQGDIKIIVDVMEKKVAEQIAVNDAQEKRIKALEEKMKKLLKETE
ncbi:MAG: hypothetical protein P1V18_04660 [Candidatus Gracilibacteria bacterium]|nr:hypothetical protein [Candidatus Gracilibacteria bacterium]